jgi:hypothetical protein
VWDWDWALHQFEVNRKGLTGHVRRRVGFGSVAALAGSANGD